MTRFVKPILLLIFMFALNANINAQETSSKLGTALQDAALKLSNASSAAKSVVDNMTPRNVDNVAPTGDAFGFPTGEVFEEGVFVGQSPMIHGHGVVEGMTYDAAPHVAYGAALGTPSFGQIENGPWYNGPTWGAFPKYHRANAPHKAKVRKLRFWPAKWRR